MKTAKLFTSVFFLFLVTIFIPGCPGNPDNPSPAKKTMLTGKIAADKGGINGIFVSLKSGEGSAITGSDGSFTLSDVSAGPHKLIIFAPGGSYKEVDIDEIKAGETKDAGTIQIEEGINNSDAEQNAKITGKIAVNKGSVKGIFVSLNTGEGSSITGSNGSFTIGDVSTGNHKLIIFAPGGSYKEVDIEIITADETKDIGTIQLDEGIPVAAELPVTPTIKRTLASVLKGKIGINSSKTAKASTTRKKTLSKVTSQEGGLWLTPDSVLTAVQADAASNSGSSQGSVVPAPLVDPVKVSVNSDGSYEVKNLPSGTGYTLTYIDNSGQGKQIDNISLTPGEIAIKNIEEVRPTGSVKMVVQSLSTGEKLGNVKASLLETGASVTSDAGTGEVSLTNIPEGNYSIIISSDGYVSKYQTFKVSSGKETDMKVIELNSLKGTLQGKVEAEGLTNFSNIVVYAKGPDGSIYTALTDSGGNYTFNAIPAANGYSVIAYAHDYTSEKADGINISKEATTTAATIVLKELPPVYGAIAGFGRFEDKADLNHEGIIVAIEGTDLEAVTARDGSFLINNITPGRYTINFVESNYKTKTLISIKVVAGATTKLTDVTLEKRAGIIKGSAKLEGKTDHSGIQVKLNGANLSAITDGAGQWQITAPVGNYASGVTYIKELFETSTDSTTITVAETGAYSVAEKTLRQNLSVVSGTVTVDGVTDYSGATIVFEGTSGSANGTTLTLNPDTDGKYSTGPLPFGDYVITITYPGQKWETITTGLSLTTGNFEIDLGTTDLRQSYVKINSDAKYTNTGNVTLSIGNSYAVKMQVSEGGTAYSEEPFNTSRSLTLGAGDGEKTVIINFVDAVGNPLPAVSDTIILDAAINITSFTAAGAGKKGEVLHLKLNANETGGSASVSVSGLVDNLKLNDNGIGGDPIANDGMYERDYKILTPFEINAPAAAIFTDRAKNTKTVNSAQNVVLSTNPTISNVLVTSNVTTGEMTIKFATDEPATTNISYGTAFNSLTNTKTISSASAENHSVVLSGLPANTITYFLIEARDTAGNTGTIQGQGKLAPPPPASINAEAGDGEVGIAWSKVTAGGADGYNLYRSENGEAYVKVNSSGPITETHYLDSSVANGSTYSYEVTAIDASGNESEKSYSVTAAPSSSLAGPTEIKGGVIDKDTIWLKSRSPYNVTADMKIKAGYSLILLPGAKLNLSGDSRYILVEGGIYGYGNAGSMVELKATDFVEKTSYYDEQHKAGAIIFNSDSIQSILNYTKINNVNIHYNVSSSKESHLVNLLIDNSVIELDHEKKVSYFYVDKIYNSTMNEYAGDNNYPTRLNVAKNDKFNYLGKANQYVTNVYFTDISDSVNCSFNKGAHDIKNADKSTFDSVNIFGSGYTTNITNSIIKNTKIAPKWSNSKDSFSINLKWNTIEPDSSVSAGKLNIAYNFWRTTDISDIADRTGYSPGADNKLYPIISSHDLFNADFDNDGLPDYIDPDNDNDGYSDLQEDKESDPLFGSVYNPLNANSHPNTAMDNDYDGIADDSDADDDNDGLTDMEEEVYTTNPKLADSDGDNTIDGDEVSFGYDPLNRNNYPLLGSISDVIIDGSNSNNSGVVFIGKDMECRGCKVSKGVRITLAKDVRASFYDSEITGTKSEPVVFRSSGASANLYVYGTTNVKYSNIKVSGYFYVYSPVLIENSDIYLINSANIYGEVKDSFINGSYLDLYGNISHSYMSSSSIGNYSGLIQDSYFAGGNYSTLYNHGNIISSYVHKLYSYNNAITESSIINNLEFSGDNPSTILNSDIKIPSYAMSTPAFFDGCYLTDQSNNNYSGYGSPVDTKGDGVAATQFTIGSYTYTVDGINHPRSSKNFPNGVSDIWNPAGVGCLWDSNNPDVFPEP